MAVAYPQSYYLSVALNPSTLTANTVYFSMKNTGTGTILLRKVAPQLFFTGTVANTISAFALQRRNNGVTPTGGTIITPTRGFSVISPASVECRFADAGLANTGTSSPDERFKIFGQPSQAVITVGHPFESSDENPLGLGPGECFFILANALLISGVRMVCDFIIYETT